MANSYEELGFDPDVLQAKYLAERDKRLKANPSGVDQYRAIEGSLAHYLDDPWVNKDRSREPLDINTTVVVIGAGYGGELLAHHLQQLGIEDFKIIEKGGDFGGVWYWNRYPGVQCDIESYIYMPLLDHIGYVPSEKYAYGPELLAHAQRIAKALNLYDKTIFKTEVLSIHWNDDTSTYSIETNRGDKISARFVVGVTGSLHRPKLPGFPGIETFKGRSFHSSRWDYQYTGGDTTGGFVNLKDKRVGIVGTGATAVQIIPSIAPWCKQLYVFQRTPSSIDVRNNRPTNADWARSLSGKWQENRMNNFNNIVCGIPEEIDLVQDGWTDIILKLYPSKSDKTLLITEEQQAKNRQVYDYQKMEEIRSRIDSVITDPETAESLKPYYNQFCKRPCFHDEYLKAFNLPNVKLIDTKGKGIERLTEKGAVVNEEEIELDCLIYATGFERATTWTHRAGMEVYGKKGQKLSEKFSEGPSTFQGWISKDFPNFFMITTLQAFVTPNLLHTTALQAEHIAYVISECKARNIDSVEPTQESEDAWVDFIVASGESSRAFHRNCTPGYYNNEGQITMKLAKNSWYGGSPVTIMNLLKDWRNSGTLEGLSLTSQPKI